MQEEKRTYIAIDLKSFFASVECVMKKDDALKKFLVVADASRTEKTICLAVSPALKAYGIPGRARLFEVIQKVKEINAIRRAKLPNKTFTGKTSESDKLAQHPDYELDFEIATPHMAKYIEFSTQIYEIYLKYISSEDVQVYSIDEVFIDATNYLATYKMTAHELARTIVQDILKTTGITATAGIGTNLYLCKIAMDIVAKHIDTDENGVRIAELDEMSYRKKLWTHEPLTDFWRVGRGTAKRLQEFGITTMGDIARFSLEHEDFLYKLFGVNAELLIDHAWGWEPCTIEYIKKYKPETNSLCSGQVLHCPYDTKKARVVAREMADSMALDLVDKQLCTNQLVLVVNYDTTNLSDTKIRATYTGPVAVDFYGRTVPKPVHGSINLPNHTSSARQIMSAVAKLYDSIVHPNLLIRRITLTANNVIPEDKVTQTSRQPQQLDLFVNYEKLEQDTIVEKEQLTKERNVQEALLSIKKKYGKNSILKGLNYQEGATTKDRNKQIGGHKA